MARPERKDVDYFPFYVKNGRTLQLLEGKYGCKGTGFFTNVLRFLSTRPDHYFSIENESDRLWFFLETKCDEESAIDMLNIMAITGKIDKDLWKYKIMASQDYLESISDAYRKRSNNIITIDEIKERFGVSGGRNSHTTEFPAEETPVSGGSYPQSKVKERKGKKRKKPEPYRLLSKEEITESSVPKLKTDIGKLCEELYQQKIFPKVHAFANQMLKKTKNPRAIIHVLSRCMIHKPQKPWAYCLQIMKVEDGNYNERDHQKNT